MTCALKGLSDLKSGKYRRLNEQYSFMSKFFHVQPPNYLSQIKLLSEGCASYRDLFEEETITNTKKKADLNDGRMLRLKQVLSRDKTRVYSGSDIRYDDLEKKNRTGSLLTAGRNLYDLAVR